MKNLLLGEKATANNYVEPYLPSRAINGDKSSTNRWLSKQVPAYLVVELSQTTWIGRWVVWHMGVAEWKIPDHNMVSYHLEGSIDGIKWYFIDGVNDNLAYFTDRTFTPVQVKMVRLCVDTGIRINPQVASCVELEIYEPSPSNPFLQSLTISAGTLMPSFESRKLNYTALVDYDVENIIVTPTSIEGGTILVNDLPAMSGKASQAIKLDKGENIIVIKVTSKIGNLVRIYNLTVTRSSNPWLLDFQITNSEGTLLPSKPNFTPENMEYTIYTDYDLPSTPDTYKVSFTAFAEQEASIKICGEPVENGQPTKIGALAIGDNAIPVEVTTGLEQTKKNYKFNIVRASNNYLKMVSIVGIGRSLKPKDFSKNIFEYNATASSNKLTITPTADLAEEVDIIINEEPVDSGKAVTIDLSVIKEDVVKIVVQATSKIGNCIKKYVFNIKKSS